MSETEISSGRALYSSLERVHFKDLMQDFAFYDTLLGSCKLKMFFSYSDINAVVFNIFKHQAAKFSIS